MDAILIQERDLLPFAKLDQTVIFGDYMQPWLEIPDLVYFQFMKESFKGLHRHVFCLLFIFQIFHTNQEDKTGIPLEKDPDDLFILSRSVGFYQLFIREEISMVLCCQCMRNRTFFTSKDTGKFTWLCEKSIEAAS